ncbi:MAG: 3-phenylpropionate/cinnamic acid dioxygenase small subunit [Massilia sp.]|jgi:ethylbenzene dioxygenase beta subunit|nr:3-phenylpropionate/cinnamic acid dioxygenase small subunit [Massilia sp.]MDB5952337.1 3-phenylpropionate/cinnamic acid dioxygenase small subunit [Massilia sp.]
MNTEKPVSRELYHEVQQALFREARLVREERFREWLETLLDKNVLYQAINMQLRFRKDRYHGPDGVYSLNDRYHDLDARVRQVETGMQWTADPRERVRHFLNNIEVFHGEQDDTYIVQANCYVVRNRRVYDEMTYSYGRTDTWRRGADGQLRLLHRLCDIDERFVRGKNHNFML